MSDPALALQAKMLTTLKGNGGVSALVGERVHDDPPANPVFPYLVIGDGQVVGDDNDCGEGSEVFHDVHVWSRAPGFPEAKSIAGAVRAALSGDIEVTGFNVTVTEFLETRYMRDPDGKTRHAVVRYRYLMTHN